MAPPDTNNLITLDHGSGGKIAHNLTTQTILPAFDNDLLRSMNDGAVLPLDGHSWAFSTDSYVVDPLFFPGGNIGDLAINGTVNDLAMCGARPLFLSVGLIMEEGLPLPDLQKVLATMGRAADLAGVQVVTGDTKVVPKGAADKLFINTAGIGRCWPEFTLGGALARPGDQIIISGTLADHGMTILTQREGLQFDTPLASDSASLNHLVAALRPCGEQIHVLRDPTRGGLGTTLNEIAEQSRVVIQIDETRLPVRAEVSAVCELLGFDPLYVANEGKMILFVDSAACTEVLETLRSDPLGSDAAVIGRVTDEKGAKVVMRTHIGGLRRLDMLAGDQLPRIC